MGELADDVNSFKFQDVLFSTHPEAFNVFMDATEYVSKDGEYKSPLKLNPRIKKKYHDLYEKYIMEQEEKKYNL